MRVESQFSSLQFDFGSIWFYGSVWFTFIFFWTVLVVEGYCCSNQIFCFFN